jgi:hypothetical protein
LTPRFGDGVDLVIGAGREEILAATEKIGLKIAASLSLKGYAFYDSLQSIIRKIALSAKKDTFLLFTADHSFDIRLRGGEGEMLHFRWRPGKKMELPKWPSRIFTSRMDTRESRSW